MRASIKLRMALVIALPLVASVSIGVAGTFAAFSKTKVVSQTIRITGSSIYLNPGVWEADGALFYLYTWDSSNDSDNAWMKNNGKHGSYYVFNSPISSDHDKCIFVRINPNGANIPSFNKDTKWNQSSDLDLPTAIENVYTITGWETGDWVTLS